MFAVVEACGKQYRVEPGEVITVDRLAAEVGSSITLDKVLLVADKTVKVGAPTVKGAAVTAKVVEHIRGEKAVTFKYRRRQRRKRHVGYRSSLTSLEITGIEKGK